MRKWASNSEELTEMIKTAEDSVLGTGAVLYGYSYIKLA